MTQRAPANLQAVYDQAFDRAWNATLIAIIASTSAPGYFLDYVYKHGYSDTAFLLVVILAFGQIAMLIALPTKIASIWAGRAVRKSAQEIPKE